jgi:hypothetical protein
MNTLLRSIENTIQSAIENYIKNICEKYSDIDPKELEKIWNNVTENIQVDVKFKNTVETKPSISSVVAVSCSSPKKEDTITKNTDNTGCQYIIQKGAKEGQPCGTKTKTNSMFCSRHMKYEGVEQKSKKILPQVKKSGKKSVVEKSSPSSSMSPSSPLSPSSTISNSSKNKCKISLFMNKDINLHWHPDTCMVFKILEGKNTAIATYKDKKFYPISEDNIETCNKWNNHPYKILSKEELEKLYPSSLEKVIEKPVDKKSLARSIADTKMQAKQVEEILDELQLSKVNDSEEETEDIEEELIDEDE